MEINVYTPKYEYSAGLLFVQKGSVREATIITENQYKFLCEFKDFKGIIEDDIKKENWGEADYSYIE